MAATPAPQPPSAELIDRLQRRRTWGVMLQGLFFVNWQLLSLPMLMPWTWSDGAFDMIRAATYLLWPALMLALIATGGGFILSREIRAVLNDETTRAHRRRAFELGFWGAMAGVLAGYGLSLAGTASPLVVVHLVLSAGLATSMIAFAVLELRAQADG
ncbi:MAG TPA: hypothetical protein VLI41_16705 [Phenylobacterium sp.]|uniref:hypothetical protein n=1 Tax=Phenylobacterium sp. TaxID=1871053 RepID=UPI002BC42F93|nr:hypothetical protein [Phenylobacterium sp.]HSV04838.1 hypothetical protein [Phenylobacterium sp.]